MGRQKLGHHFGAAAVLGRSQFVLRTARRKVRERNKSPRLRNKSGEEWQEWTQGWLICKRRLHSRFLYRHTECPLSVAQDILENGFIIGNSEAMWFCTRGLVGYGRFHAQDRSRHEIGWTENGKPCLWTQAVTVSSTLPKSAYSGANHEPVGKGTISLRDVMRLNILPGAHERQLTREERAG